MRFILEIDVTATVARATPVAAQHGTVYAWIYTTPNPAYMGIYSVAAYGQYANSYAWVYDAWSVEMGTADWSKVQAKDVYDNPGLSKGHYIWLIEKGKDGIHPGDYLSPNPWTKVQYTVDNVDG